MEFLVNFADTQDGFQYLLTEGILEWLVNVSYGQQDISAGRSSPRIDPILSSHALCQLGDIFLRASSKETLDTAHLASLDKRLVDIFCTSIAEQMSASPEERRLAGRRVSFFY